MIRGRRLACVLLAVLAACAQRSDDDETTIAALTSEEEEDLPPRPFADGAALPSEIDDAVTRLPWAPVGAGVSYKAFATGKNVVAIYGGYTAEETWVQRWADQIYRARGGAFDIGHLYAVKGPNTAGYTNHEIENSKLVAHLAGGHRAADATAVVVIAHSSGTYVADEMFRFLKNGAGGIPASTVSKVRLFNLDGGGVSDATLVRSFARTYFVYACDHGIGRCSHNAGAMQSLGQTYAAEGGAFEVIANGSHCDRSAAGGLWCMHDTLVNTRPHNPQSYDLKWDYGDFTSPRALVTSYLDQPL